MNKLFFFVYSLMFLALTACTTPADTQVKKPSMPKYTPQYTSIDKDRYIISGDEVYDRKTERIWKRCNYGQRWDDKEKWCKGLVKRVPIADAKSAIENIGGGWRVPDVSELMSLFEVYCSADKSKVQEIFADILHHEWYATSTPNGETHFMAVECFGSRASSAGVGKRMQTPIRLVREAKGPTRINE